MIIAGLIKTTLLDYPEHVAATVFTGGCNFRCPYCHNGEFVKRVSSLSEDEVLGFLTKRVNILEGVCISGGEPTIQPDLPDFISRIKELGYSVKLDTNGTNPDMLKELISGGLVDYVAMDIKNSPEKYAMTAGITEEKARNRLLENVHTSIDILKEGHIPCEFRTTVVRELHTADDIKKIDKLIAGAPKYYIQSFKDSENVIERGRFSAYTKEELTELINVMKNVEPVLRGIE